MLDSGKRKSGGVPEVGPDTPLVPGDYTRHRLVEVSLEELEAQVRRAIEEPTSRHVALQSCKSCGAEVEIPKELAIAACLFCGRKATCGEPEPSAQPPEQGLIPFSFDREHAVEAMQQHVKSLWLRPGGIASRISTSTVRKVFVPFWAFDSEISTNWKGNAEVWQEAGWLARKFGSNGSYRKKPISGNRSESYDDWLVCASHGLRPEVLHQVEPFHTGGLLKAADREEFLETPLEVRAVGPREGWSRAQTAIRKNEFKECLKDARIEGGVEEDRVTIAGEVDCSEPLGKAVVLPLYIFNCGSQGKIQIVVNGETGKVGSVIGYSWPKVLPLAFLAFIIAIVICVISGGLAIPLSMLAAAHHWWKSRRRRKRDEATFVSA